MAKIWLSLSRHCQWHLVSIGIPTVTWSQPPAVTVCVNGLVSSSELAMHSGTHRPYSRQVTEQMGCNVVIHPPPSIYPKAGNGALRDQWAIKYNCQNYSSTIAFTVRELVHWNYVISQNIPCVCKSWKSLSIYVFAAYIFFVHPTLSPLK